MSTKTPEVDLTGIDDPQRTAAFVVGLLLVGVGVGGTTGIVDGDVVGPGLVLGVFGVPLWLGVTAIVAGVLGIVLSFYEGAGTTFDKLAAGLVLPPVLFLAVIDWLFAGGITVPMVALAIVPLLLAVVFVAVGTVLLWGHPLVVVLPVVALLAIADWALGLTAMVPSDPVNLPTIGLLAVLAILVGLVAFEGGTRMT